MFDVVKKKMTSNVFSIDDLLQDTDSELDEEEEGVSKKKSKRKRGNDAWLMESGENIVDFMDPGASKQVLGSCLFCFILLHVQCFYFFFPFYLYFSSYVHCCQTQAFCLVS